ncbi:MAG: class I SAM-dependent methyltransferase [Nitrospinales bacterium]
MTANPYSKFDDRKTLNKTNLPSKKNERILQFLEENPTGLILDLGSGNSAISHPHLIQLDCFRYANTNALGDALALPFKKGVFEAVFCHAVLEHVPSPFAASEEIKRVLRSGGIVDISVPFLFPYHDVPDHYFNMSVSGVRTLFEDFRELESGVLLGSAYALRQIIGNYKKMLKRVYRDKETPFWEKLRGRLVYRFFSWSIKFNLEKFKFTPEEDHVLAGAVYFRGRKVEGDRAGTT